MAEITTISSLQYDDDEGSPMPLGGNTVLTSMGNARYTRQKISIGTSEEILYKGEVTNIGWAWFKNYDDTNFIEIRVGTGGSKFARVQPNSEFSVYLGSDCSQPYAIADTGACLLEYAFFAR